MDYQIEPKKLALVIACYVLWGLQSLYWALLTEFSSMFVLSARIIWAAALLVLLLWAQGRLGELAAVFRNRRTMKYLIPATLFLLVDWGVFIWAVQAGHVLDVSLGYYMQPLVVFLVGAVFFREKWQPLQLCAVGLAIAGVLFSLIYYGRFPLVSVVLSLVFAVYGALKKYARVEPIVSICAESLMMVPLAAGYVLFCCRGAGGLASVTLSSQALLILSGVVTALPMILYSVGVNSMPFLVLGFCQYISPTIGIFCGLFLGEALSPEKLVTFLFIWAGLLLFSFSTLRQEKKRRAAQAAEAAQS